MKERTHYLDVAKGILILLLVMSHFSIALKWANINAGNPYFTAWYYPQPLFQVFFMQCFFIVSGLCSNFDVAPIVYIKKLWKQLLIPWLFFELVRVAYFASQGQFVRVFPGNEYTSLWFLNALFFAKIICWLIHRFFKSIITMLTVTLVLLAFGVFLNEFSFGQNILYYRQGLIGSFFVASGYFLKKHQKTYDALLKYSIFIFTAIVSLRFLHICNLPIQDANIGVQLSTTPLFLLTSLTGSFAFLWLCRIFNCNKFFEYFGRNSLIIYGLHIWPYVIIIGITSHLIGFSSQWQALIFIFTSYICEVFIMPIAIEILNTRYLRFLIGKF